MTYAVFDPNWGNPQPVLETIRETPEEAIKAAINLEKLNLYSGGSSYCVPPLPGQWSFLRSAGYRVFRITIIQQGEVTYDL